MTIVSTREWQIIKWSSQNLVRSPYCYSCVTLHTSPPGKQQALNAGQEIREIVGDETVRFFVSPYTRSTQTFEGIIAGTIGYSFTQYAWTSLTYAQAVSLTQRLILFARSHEYESKIGATSSNMSKSKNAGKSDESSGRSTTDFHVRIGRTIGRYSRENSSSRHHSLSFSILYFLALNLIFL